MRSLNQWLPGGQSRGPGASEQKNPAEEGRVSPRGRASEESHTWDPTPAHQLALGPQQCHPVPAADERPGIQTHLPKSCGAWEATRRKAGQ